MKVLLTTCWRTCRPKTMGKNDMKHKGILLAVFLLTICLPACAHRPSWDDYQVALENCNGQNLACFEQILGPPHHYRLDPHSSPDSGIWRASWQGKGRVEGTPRMTWKPWYEDGVADWDGLNQVSMRCDLYIYMYEGVHIDTWFYGKGCGNPRLKGI